jgi:hypothetical protein
VSALPGQQRLTIVPCDLARANAFVHRFHRHHQPMPTHKFSLAVHDESGLVRGVAIVMRPAARLLDNGYTAEVARLATDGCPNACSALYGAAWRAARAMGYRRMTTYILDSEAGTSLRASGWRCTRITDGDTWFRPNQGRYRDDTRYPTSAKQRWEVGETGPFPAYPSFPVDPKSPQRSLFDLLDVVNQ